jgi:integrase
VKIKVPEIVFHSLRHNFKDAMRRIGVPDSVQDRTLGHAEQHVSRRYGTAELLPEEADWIDRLDYPGVDLSFLRE